ncbi:unnamed protein product, partial [Nesidiocoris tenuis]
MFQVFVAINSSHLVLAANEEQTIYPINPNNEATTAHTSFPVTYLGGVGTSLRKYTANIASRWLIGCMEDTMINGQWITRQRRSATRTSPTAWSSLPSTKPPGGPFGAFWTFPCSSERGSRPVGFSTWARSPARSTIATRLSSLPNLSTANSKSASSSMVYSNRTASTGCECPVGHKGKQCKEMEFCQVQDCPTGSECRNLNTGYECVANITIHNPNETAPGLHYEFVQSDSSAVLAEVSVTYRSKTGGTILQVGPSKDENYLFMDIYNDQITVSWSMGGETEVRNISKDPPDGDWTTVILRMSNNLITGSIAGGLEESPQMFTANFSLSHWASLVRTSRITVAVQNQKASTPVSAGSASTATSANVTSTNARTTTNANTIRHASTTLARSLAIARKVTRANYPSTADNFTCSCDEGFVGEYCESPFCVVKPCQHGDCVNKLSVSNLRIIDKMFVGKLPTAWRHPSRLKKEQSQAVPVIRATGVNSAKWTATSARAALASTAASVSTSRTPFRAIARRPGTAGRRATKTLTNATNRRSTCARTAALARTRTAATSASVRTGTAGATARSTIQSVHQQPRDGYRPRRRADFADLPAGRRHLALRILDDGAQETRDSRHVFAELAGILQSARRIGQRHETAARGAPYLKDEFLNFIDFSNYSKIVQETQKTFSLEAYQCFGSVFYRFEPDLVHM